MASANSSWSGRRHFTGKFSHKTALVTCPCAFRLRSLTQSVGCDLGARHFPIFSCKFSRKMALRRCPSAFRLRRLAQNVRLTSGLRPSRKMALVTCPFWLRRLAQSLCRALGLRHFHFKFSRKRALAEILLHSFLRGPCMILYRSLTEDLVEILLRSSFQLLAPSV